MSSSSNAGTEVWIDPSSPLLQYTSGSWVQSKSGHKQCQGSDQCTVDVQALYCKLTARGKKLKPIVSDIEFFYTSNSQSDIQVRLDGEPGEQPAKNGVVTASSKFGKHTAKLECSCQSCQPGSADSVTFMGVKLHTQVTEIGQGNNVTIDDASEAVTYSGFQSTSSSNSDIQPIKTGDFYDKTVSYTSTGGATASLSCQGSAIYVVGMTGPEFGGYQIELNDQDMGSYNACTAYETYNNLLFFATYLDSSKPQALTITNQVDGSWLALDYVVCVQPDSQGSKTSSGDTPGATAVFPDENKTIANGTGDSGGAIIGGILGGLAALFLLWIWWKYRQWKKAGGTGSFWAALCGPGRVKKEAAKEEEAKFHLWPMIWSRPKYAT
ncbi:hypothetical protein IAU59_000936 [Kwoniella sp. CBS 9459]